MLTHLAGEPSPAKPLQGPPGVPAPHFDNQPDPEISILPTEPSWYQTNDNKSLNKNNQVMRSVYNSMQEDLKGDKRGDTFMPFILVS